MNLSDQLEFNSLLSPVIRTFRNISLERHKCSSISRMSSVTRVLLSHSTSRPKRMVESRVPAKRNCSLVSAVDPRFSPAITRVLLLTSFEFITMQSGG